jgi:NADH-quinone oxidoreductase subunit E
LGLFLQIVVFLIVAAALGFAVGWLMRGARLQEEHDSSIRGWGARLSSVESERDQLREQLAAAGEGKAASERAQCEAEQRAATGEPELRARATRLERELEEARERGAGQQAEIERLEGKVAELQTGAAAPARAPAAGDAAPAAANHDLAEPAGLPEETPPLALPGAQGQPDDLKRISGIGPGIERTLHELGIYHFHQIAAFTPANIAWINRRLRFKGRIEREDWIGQARTLAEDGAAAPGERQQAGHS